MKIHEYNEMMAYLTRPARTGFNQGTQKRRYLSPSDKPVIGTAQDIQGSYIRGKEVKKPKLTWDLSKRKWTPDKAVEIMNEYKALVDDAFAKSKMGDLPTFSNWVKNKYGSAASSAVFYARRGMEDELFRSLTSGDYARDKKIELVRKLIAIENADLKGETSLGRIVRGTVLPEATKPQLKATPVHGPDASDFRVIISKLQPELDTKYDKVRKALAEILGNKEAIFDKTILQQIKEKTGLDRKTITHRTEGGKRIPGALDVIPEWNKVGSFIEGVPDKEVYAQMSFSRSKIGGNYTLNEMLQIATDTLQGKGAGLDDWQKVAGDTPSQYAVRTAGREWVAKQGKGKITFYDKNLKEIPWGKKFSSQDTFFTYNDPRYKNKFYGLNKPSKNALKILSKKFPGYTIHDLKSQIKNLPEWKEVRDVVQAKRELLGDSGINPFTGKKESFKKIADDINTRVLSSATGKAFKPGYYTVGIDHKAGMAESLFNDFRLVTARDNHAFYAIKNDPELRNIASQMEEVLFSPKLEGNLTAQKNAISNFYKNLGNKIVKATAEGKTTILPTSREEAAIEFLKKGKYTTAEKTALEKIAKPVQALIDLYKGNAAKQSAVQVLLGCRGKVPAAKGGRIGFAEGSLDACVIAKIKADPEGVANKIGRAMPETRTPIINALKKFGMGTLKWGARGFIGLTPIFAGMEIKEQSRKFKEGVPAGQLVADLGEWVLPGVSGAYKAKQKSDMIKDIANPEELKILDKKAKYDSAKEMFDLGAIGWGEEERAAKEMAENQLTEEEELSLSNLEKSARDLETFKMERLSAERAARPLPGIDPFQAAEGGRVGFDEGSKPKSPGRRAFIKGITALAALPLVGKYFKLGKVLERAQPYYGPTVEKIKGMPEWFPSLVKKLWNEGEDVTKQVAYKDRQVVKRGTLEGGDDVDMIYDIDTGDVSINVTPKKGKYETTSGAYNKEYSLDYKKGELIEEGKYAGSRSSDDFNVTELEGRMDPHAMDIDWDANMTTVDDAMSDLTELEAFAKSKSTKQLHKKKGTKKKDVFPDYDPPGYDY